jgi:hypothetical protein
MRLAALIQLGALLSGFYSFQAVNHVFVLPLPLFISGESCLK